MGEIADALRRARESRTPDGSEPRPYPDDLSAPRMRPPEPSTPRETDAPTLPSWEKTPAESELVALEHADPTILLDDSPNLEACRRLAVRLRDSMERRGASSVAVVSSTRGEGKTTLACNLALAMASLSPGREVALVDLDLRNPSLVRVFGLSPRIGFEQVLRGAAALEESRITVQRPPVDIYPVIKAQHAAHELLVTAAFGEVVRQLEQRYKVVFFDTAPVLAVPDVSLMLRHVGLCVPVARIGVTRTRTLRHLMDVLPHERLLGPVLNGVQLSPEMSYDYVEDDSPDAPSADERERHTTRARGGRHAREGGEA